MKARFAVGPLMLAALAQAASAATLSLSVESQAIHADMPFTLVLEAKGFEEAPTPAPPDLAIEGCEVTYLGVSPNVSSSIQIVNGRRSEWREVTFVYRWRVLAGESGRYTIPPLRVEQAGVDASSRTASFDANEVPATDDMSVRMQLPERALWVGETFDVSVEWLLARDVKDYQFSVPLFNLDGAEVAPAPTPTGRSAPFNAGARQVELPLSQSTVLEERNTRLSFHARVTLNRAGSVDLPPVRVVAQLRSGATRDSWGFRRPTYGLFRAEGAPRRLTVRPLPVAGRPPTFVNAIGSGFAIDVQASRTVVSVGEPVELTVRLRGDGPLTGLSLPPLDGPGGLPAAHFSVPEGSVAGEVDEETNSKLFTFTARVKSADVREIPPIAFSYFDPATGEYRTVTSEPVALSVGAGRLVGVADVVAAPTVNSQVAREDRPDAGGAIATLVGADMSLSTPQATLAIPWGNQDSRLLLGALYGAPLVAALVAFALARSGGRRTRNRSVRQALRALERALNAAQPARQAAPGIVAALRRLADVSGNDPRETSGIVERLETRAFDPAAADQTVPGEIVAELRRVAREWARRPGVPTHTTAKASAAVVSLVALAVLTTSPESMAADGSAGGHRGCARPVSIRHRGVRPPTPRSSVCGCRAGVSSARSRECRCAGVAGGLGQRRAGHAGCWTCRAGLPSCPRRRTRQRASPRQPGLGAGPVAGVVAASCRRRRLGLAAVLARSLLRSPASPARRRGVRRRRVAAGAVVPPSEMAGRGRRAGVCRMDCGGGIGSPDA